MATKHDNRRNLERPDATAEGGSLGVPPSGTRKSPVSIDEAGIAELIAFFRILRKWDLEARCHEKMQ